MRKDWWPLRKERQASPSGWASLKTRLPQETKMGFNEHYMFRFLERIWQKSSSCVALFYCKVAQKRMGELPVSDVLLFKVHWRMEEEWTGLWGHLGLLTAVKCHALMFRIVTYTVFNLVSADSSCTANLPSSKRGFSTEILILICRTYVHCKLFQPLPLWSATNCGFTTTEFIYKRRRFTATFQSLCTSTQ